MQASLFPRWKVWTTSRLPSSRQVSCSIIPSSGCGSASSLTFSVKFFFYLSHSSSPSNRVAGFIASLMLYLPPSSSLIGIGFGMFASRLVKPQDRSSPRTLVALIAVSVSWLSPPTS